MHPVFATAGKNQAIPIWFVNAANFDEVRKKLGSSEQAFISTAAFEAKAGRSLLLPGSNGKLAGVLFGIEGPDADVQVVGVVENANFSALGRRLAVERLLLGEAVDDRRVLPRFVVQHPVQRGRILSDTLRLDLILLA